VRRRDLSQVIASIVVLLLTTAASAPGAAAAPASVKVVASAGQMLHLADLMVREGKTRGAETIFDLLAHDPDSYVRNEARFRHARLLIALKRHNEAALLLRRLLEEKPKAVPARLELAGTLQVLGDTNGALRELRAVQAVGLPPAAARLIDRYSAALRAQRPFGASFEIAIAPDSNINRATRSDTLGTVFGDFEISDDGKAQSGTGLSLTGQAFRRFGIGDDASLLVRVSGLANLYRRDRFNDLTADFAVGPELNFGSDRLQIELGATQRWFGQKPFMRSARLAETYSHPLGSRTLARVSGSAALIDNQMNDLQDGKIFSGQIAIERALTPTMGLAVSFGMDRQSLRSPAYSTTAWRGALTGWRDLGRMTVTAGVELGRLHADERLALFPSKRSDRYSRFSVGATFRQLQLYGFAPLLRFSIERNRSSITFYDYRRKRTEVGIVHAF
jgi:hypothetical protein